MQMQRTFLTDPRVEKDFQSKTFSKYKLYEVKRQLMKTLKDGKIEESCYWSAEMICSGHFGDLWEVVIEFYGRHVYHENPKLSIYLSRRVLEFVSKIKEEEKKSKGSIIQLRNDVWVRETFGEIMCILCETKQALEFQDIRISPEMLNLDNIPHRVQAPSFAYVLQFMKEGENQCAEFFVAMNELIFHLIEEETKNIYSCCFWIDWIFMFAMAQKKYYQEKKLNCHPRLIPNLKPIYHQEFVWLIWEVVMLVAVKLNHPLIIEIISSLLCLFTVKYEGWKRTAVKRKHLLKFAFLLLIEESASSRPLCQESTKQKIHQVKENLFKIYQKIKKNEFAITTPSSSSSSSSDNSFLNLLMSTTTTTSTTSRKLKEKELDLNNEDDAPSPSHSHSQKKKKKNTHETKVILFEEIGKSFFPRVDKHEHEEQDQEEEEEEHEEDEHEEDEHEDQEENEADDDASAVFAIASMDDNEEEENINEEEKEQEED